MEHDSTRQEGEGFQTFVAGKLEGINNYLGANVTEKLDDILGKIVSQHTYLSENLPDLLKRIVQDQLNQTLTPGTQIQSDPPGYKATSSNAAEQEIVLLRGNNQKLTQQVDTQKAQIASLNQELAKKTRDAKKLHEIIIQSGQSPSQIDDESINKAFSELSYNIMRVANKHFSALGGKTSLPAYKHLSREDRGLCIRAAIADGFHRCFFHRTARVFGISKEADVLQRKLEKELIESEKVPISDIHEWRASSIKVGRAMQHKTRLYRCYDLADDFCKDFKDFIPSPDTEDQKDKRANDVEDLCAKALELALMLREAPAKYDWGQDIKPERLQPEDMELIGPYNVRGNGGGKPMPVRVLFGPVWKVEDGEHIVMRKGDVLEGEI